MTTPKPAEIWKLKDGKTVRVEYFMTTQYLCTIVTPAERGSTRCIHPVEFEHKLQKRGVKQNIHSQIAGHPFQKGRL